MQITRSARRRIHHAWTMMSLFCTAAQGCNPGRINRGIRRVLFFYIYIVQFRSKINAGLNTSTTWVGFDMNNEKPISGKHTLMNWVESKKRFKSQHVFYWCGALCSFIGMVIAWLMALARYSTYMDGKSVMEDLNGLQENMR